MHRRLGGGQLRGPAGLQREKSGLFQSELLSPLTMETERRRHNRSSATELSIKLGGWMPKKAGEVKI